MAAKKAKEVYVLPDEDAPSAAPTAQAIAARAFEIFLERGGSHGRDVEDWLRAERELRGS